MSKYLFHGSYTSDGLKGLMEEGGSKRVEAAQQALGSVGGTLEAFYFAFGEDDFGKTATPSSIEVQRGFIASVRRSSGQLM